MGFPLNLATFRERYPEFEQTPDALVQAKLDAAERSTNSTVWGELAEDGHGLLAAMLLAHSPYGRDARLVDEEGESVYSKEYNRLARLVGVSHRPVLT